jgi:hypothetical protein
MTKILDNLKIVGTSDTSNALNISKGYVISTGAIYANGGIDAESNNILYVGLSASLIKTQNLSGLYSSVWNNSYINWNGPSGTASITNNNGVLEFVTPTQFSFLDYNNNQPKIRISPNTNTIFLGSDPSTVSNTIVNSSIISFDAQYWNGLTSVTVSVPLQNTVDNLIGDHRFTIGTIFNIKNDLFVGINTSVPTATLDVVGTLRFSTGNEGLNKLLSSDALGNADWIPNTFVSGDGNGTVNYISKWGTPSSLVDSRIFDDGVSIGIGHGGLLHRRGEIVHSNGTFSTYGDAQTSNLISRIETSTNVLTEMLLGATGSVIVINNKTISFFKITLGSVNIISGDSSIKVYKGGIKNLAGTASIIGSVVEESVTMDLGAQLWTSIIDANSNYLRIRVSGENGSVIRWVAKVELVEISYAGVGAFQPGFSQGFF